MNLFFYLAIQHLDLGKGVAIEFIGPITVAALRTRTSRNAIALVLAVVGVVILSGLELGNEPLGLIYIFLTSYGPTPSCTTPMQSHLFPVMFAKQRVKMGELRPSEIPVSIDECQRFLFNTSVLNLLHKSHCFQ